MLKQLSAADSEMRAAGLDGGSFMGVGGDEVWGDPKIAGVLARRAISEEVRCHAGQSHLQVRLQGRCASSTLWSGKYDYRSPSLSDADRPKYAEQMKQLQQWLDEAKAKGIKKRNVRRGDQARSPLMSPWSTTRRRFAPRSVGLLRLADYEVAAFGSGEDVSGVARRRAVPTARVLDVHMAGALRLRDVQARLRGGVTAIFPSCSSPRATTSRSISIGGREQGGATLLRKPFSNDALLAAVGAALRNKARDAS